MKWIVLLLLLQSAAPPDLDITWREPQTIRVIWSGQSGVCLWLDGHRLDTPCMSFGTRLIGISGLDVQVDPGMLLELRSGATILASQVIPDNPFPQNLTVTKTDATYHITWQTPSGNVGCVVRADPFFPQTFAPCAPSGEIEVIIPPGSRIALQVNGKELARILIAPLPPISVAYLPLVVR